MSEPYFGEWKTVTLTVEHQVRMRVKVCEDYDNDRVAADALASASNAAERMVMHVRDLAMFGGGYQVEWMGGKLKKTTDE